VLAALYMAGAAAADFVARRRERSGFNLDLWLKRGSVLNTGGTRQGELPSPLRQLLQDVERAQAEEGLGHGTLEHLVLEREERIRKALNGPRTLVKVGPSLGLLGTLIPMGQSLASLAAGNLEAMAGQMVVAFTTTIIGLATGTLAYVVATARLNWINETVREQRYLAERILLETEQRSVQPEYVRKG
jgi:biopolymer transport protein ExbB/TolQ